MVIAVEGDLLGEVGVGGGEGGVCLLDLKGGDGFEIVEF